LTQAVVGATMELIMDIIASTTKKEIQDTRGALLEIERNLGFGIKWLPSLPRTNSGEKIYIVENSLVIGCGIIKTISCGNKGYYLQYGDFIIFKKPLKYISFPGHRYVDKLPKDIQKKLRKGVGGGKNFD